MRKEDTPSRNSRRKYEKVHFVERKEANKVWGTSVPRTFADDNDPLDVLVLCSEKIEPMALVRCYPIGVISLVDGGHADDKIIAIPFGDPTYSGYKDISQLPKHIFDEMTHFFTVYKNLEEKETAVEEVANADAAIKIIEEAIARYNEVFLK